MTPTLWAVLVALCVLAAVFFIWLTVWMVRNEKKTKAGRILVRQEYERAFAEMRQRYGWQVQPPMDPHLAALFPYAAHKESVAVFAGQWRGRPFAVCNYWTQSRGLSSEPSAAFGDGGRTTYTTPHWAVMVAMPAALPEMELRQGSSIRGDKPTFLDRLSSPPPPLGDEAFDRRFIVIAKDRSAIPAVFTPRTRSLVLADPRFSEWRLGFWESNLYTEADGGATPERMGLIAPKLDMLCDFLDQLPRSEPDDTPSV